MRSVTFDGRRLQLQADDEITIGRAETSPIDPARQRAAISRCCTKLKWGTVVSGARAQAGAQRAFAGRGGSLPMHYPDDCGS